MLGLLNNWSAPIIGAELVDNINLFGDLQVTIGKHICTITTVTPNLELFFIVILILIFFVKFPNLPLPCDHVYNTSNPLCTWNRILAEMPEYLFFPTISARRCQEFQLGFHPQISTRWNRLHFFFIY